MHDFVADDRISALVCSRVRGEKTTKNRNFSSIVIASGTFWCKRADDFIDLGFEIICKLVC